MRLIVLTGFLGSGKTTALLSLARELQAGGSRVAMVVNEIGDIGIDDRLLERLGGNVWELLGGCICCTLAGRLGETLAEVARTHAPDVVLIEPSGASHPETIDGALAGSHGPVVEAIARLAIVDPLRLTELVAVLEPLLEAHVRHANAVLITKADLASAAEIEAARNWVQSLRADLPCFAADLKTGAGRPPVSELLPCLN